MMKQRLVFLVALVCIAQLGFVVLTEVNRYVRGRSQQGFAVVTQNVPPKLLPDTDRASLKAGAADSSNQRKLANATQRKLETPAKNEGAKSPLTAANREPRDPFVPFFSIKQGGGNAATSTPADFELSELRVTAIIKDSQGNYSASVKAPNERNFIIKVGSLIGLNGGKVTAITDSKILVSESSDAGVDGSSTALKELVLKRSEPVDG